MHNRRLFFGLPACLFAVARGLPTVAKATSFADLLSQLSDTDALATRASREYLFRLLVQTESQGVKRRAKSDLQISSAARDLIIRFEVSSPKRYIQDFQSPLWPGGKSGVTIGIGYDLGYMTPTLVESDWGNILTSDVISRLVRATGKTGARARKFLGDLDGITVSWEQANSQFARFLPNVVAETAYAFPNLAKLSKDSRGALVSLVYNRGGDTRDTPRRKEMHRIRNHMEQENFQAIPDEIISMKHLWENSNLPGLLLRRELEAALFLQGLN